MSKADDCMIEEIIDRELVTAFFQPLVFIKKKQVAGYRAICRGKNTDGYSITAEDMVREAGKYGLVLQIDRLLRKKSLDGFLPFYRSGRDMLLLLNINSSAVKNGFGSGNFQKSVESCGIDPSGVILGIAESGFDNTSLLLESVKQYRRSGFMIAIDGSGADISGMNRIMVIRPDVIRLDSQVIQGISCDFIKQDIAGSFISLARKIGALVIAEGVNNEDDALRMIELEADVLQGDFFSEPCIQGELDALRVEEKITALSLEYFKMNVEQSNNERLKKSHAIAILDGIVKEILEIGKYSPGDAIKKAVGKFGDIECAYLLDDNGIQITDTVINRELNNLVPTRIFHPDMICTDHSSRNCYVKLVCGEDYYISQPYISHATGNICVTASRRYATAEGDGRILCADLSARDRNL